MKRNTFVLYAERMNVELRHLRALVTLAESDSEVANMMYIEDSKLDDGTLLVVVA